MPMIPTGLKNEIRSKFTELRKELSKNICVYATPTRVDCPNCLHDHTGVSINKYDTGFVSPVVIFGHTINPSPFTRGRCPVCSGGGKLESENKSTIKVLIRWNPPGVGSRGELEKTPGGIEGYNVVLVKAAKCHYEILRDCTKALIDGVECTLFLPPVIRGVGEVDVVAEAYFVATQVGRSTRG